MVERMPAIGVALLPSTSHTSGISGKLSVPVSAPSAVYARFRHVVGVSADGANGVPLVKLRILDNLIESYMKAQRAPLPLPAEDMVVEVSPRSIDNLIAALSADLRAEAAGRGGAGAHALAPGAVLKLDA